MATYYGTYGDDFYQLSSAFPLAYGLPGNDTLYGSDNSNDTLYGNTGDDELYGNAGNDILVGSFGNDILNGGSGDDMLIGGIGNDLLAGAGGSDRYLLKAGQGTDFIEGFQDGQDFIVLAGGLTFEQLTITQSTSFPYYFAIGITSTGEVLATVAPSQPNTHFTAADFITI